MGVAYVVGRMTVKDQGLWDEYRSKVPATLTPWGGELVFRGTLVAALCGEERHPDVVVIRFPSVAAVEGWFGSSAYQALVPLREQAAEMVFLSYQA